MVKVMTWNVNSIKMRKDRLLKILNAEAPEIVCLQELKCVDEAFPLEEIRSAGYHAAVYGQKTYNGVAVLSRQPLTNIQKGLAPHFEDTASRLLGVDTYGIRVYSAYIPNGQSVGSDKYAYKLDWFKGLRKLLQEETQKNPKLVIAGDFNVAPEDRDVHDPKAWDGAILCSAAEREHLKAITEVGLYDTFRKHISEAGFYSWWDYRNLSFPKNYGLRIDLILSTVPLYEVCSATKILRDERKGEGPSDHAPVVAAFAL